MITRPIPDECKPIKQQIKEAMQEIALRRPGRTRLVYDRATKTIVAIDRSGMKAPSGLNITSQDADVFCNV